MFNSTSDYVKNIDSLVSHLKYEGDRQYFLKSLIKKYGSDNEVAKDIRDHMSGFRSVYVNSKRFNYNSSIVSLYGFLENYLEAVIKELVLKINSARPKFNNLPKEIRNSHLNTSIDLITKIQRDRSLSKDVKDELIKTIVYNLNSCAQGDDGYRLNEDSFSIHTANFRYDSIHSFFNKVGVSHLPRRTLKCKNLQVSLAEKHSGEKTLEQKLLVSLLQSELDDLAQRRNEIAHGSFEGEIESIDLLINRAVFLKAFGCAIDKILNDYYYEFAFSSGLKVSIGKPDKVYNKIKVIGFSGENFPDESLGGEIYVGQKIFAFNDSGKNKLKHGSIVSIKSNGSEFDRIKIKNKTSIGVMVDFDLSSHDSSRVIYTASIE
ncbi:MULTISPECIES: HEPN domain-containing protein [unclassified Endozoicomonas]|uniref:HEPN domain-containing protein n=1 Tax=unclassified Endozoicomonas TaxID=2644528 RepID=UPI003BB81080